MENEKENDNDLRAQNGTGEGNVPTGVQNATAGDSVRKDNIIQGKAKMGRLVMPSEVLFYQHSAGNQGVQNANWELPVFNIEAEMAVLGAMLLGNTEAIETAADIVDSADFYREAHTHIFRAMTLLADQGDPVDIVTLKDELTRVGKLEEVGGVPYLMALADYTPTTANVAYYAKAVRDTAKIRRTREAGTRITLLSHDGERTADDIADEAESILLSATEGTGSDKGEWVSAGDANDELLVELVDRANGKTKNVKSGLIGIDQVIPGFVAGGLHILAARPAQGKTAAALTIGDLIAERGLKVAFFSMEMKNVDIAERRLAKYAQINSRKFAEPRFNDDEKTRIKWATEKIRELPFYCDDSASLTVRAMRSRLRRVRRQLGGLDFVIVDYIQLAAGESARAQRDKRNEVMEVTGDLRILAQEFDVPILALAQLNRDCEKREDKRPQLSDLAESGRLEADAWTVSFLYRASYYDKDANLAADAVDEVEWIVAKQRNGLTRTAKLGFRLPYTQFVDIAAEGGRF